LIPRRLPPFDPWIEDKRISNYSSRFLPLIGRFDSSCCSMTIHKQKFNKIWVFLGRIKSTFASSPNLIVMLPPSAPFIRFDLFLRSIIDLAPKCTGGSDFSAENSVHAMLLQFLEFRTLTTGCGRADRLGTRGDRRMDSKSADHHING
jgi:hypothetical protein